MQPGYVPQDAVKKAVDLSLARGAAGLAIERHAGAVSEVMTATGPVQIQEGKDLSSVSTVICVGGVLARGQDPAFVLAGVLTGISAPPSLGPTASRLFVDRSCILFGVGLLAQRFPREAFQIATNYLLPIES